MKKLMIAAFAASVALTSFGLTSVQAAFAQPDYRRDNHGGYGDHNGYNNHADYRRHDEWRRGAHIRHEDWNRGRPVDWRHSHLHRPARGYEWREVDGNYVLAAIATGLIVSAIAHN